MQRLFVLLLFWFLQNSVNCDVLPYDQEINTDFLFHLKPEVDNNLTPPYVLDFITKNPRNSTLTASDIINVLGLQQLSLQEVKDVLTRGNIDPKIIFSADYVAQMKMSTQITTSSFLDGIRTELGVFDDRTAKGRFLKPLGIEEQTYSSDYEYNELEMLNIGIFTEDTLKQATAAIQRTLDDLYVAIRNTFFKHIERTPEVFNWTIVNSALFPQKSLNTFAEGVPIRVQNIEKSQTFLDLFKEINSELQSYQLILGALTDFNKVTVNRDTAMHWKKYSEMVKINASAINSNLGSLILGSKLTPTPAENIFELTATSNANSKYAIRPGKPEGSLENCTFLTIEQPNWTQQSEIIPNISIYSEVLAANSSVMREKIVLGSALVCKNRLIGLQRHPTNETSDFNIVFDALYDGPEPQLVSGELRPLLSTLLMLIYAFMYLFMH